MQSAVFLLDRLAKRTPMTILFALSAAVFAAIQYSLAHLAGVSGGYGILDFDVGYGPDRVAEVLGSYGAEGMAIHSRIQMLDLLNPALYALVLACVARILWRGRGPVWLALVPLLAGLGDYLENATLFLIARAFPEVPAGLVAISNWLNLLKYGLLAAAMAVILAGIAARFGCAGQGGPG